MSTVAIFVSKGSILAGSAAMSSAFLAMGIGVGVAFYLHYRHEIKAEERQRLTREVENSCYRLRSRIDSLPQVLQDSYADELNQLRQLEDSVKTAIADDDLCTIPAAIAALQRGYADLRQRIVPALLALEEPAKVAQGTAMSFSDQIRQREQVAGIEEEMAPEISAPDRKERRRIRIAEDALRYHLLVAHYDAAAAELLAPLLEELKEGTSEQRCGMIRDTMRLKYGRLKEAAAATIIHREILSPLPDQIRHLPGGGAIADELDLLVNSLNISAEEYQEGVRKAHDLLFRHYEEMALLGRVQETLQQLGYATVQGVEGITEEGLLAGEVFFVETPFEGYRIMLRLSAQGELLTRLVRLVASESEKQSHSSYQRQKDMDVARRWCGDYDRFLAALGEKGVACSVNLRKSAEEEEVLCIVDASVQRRTASTAKSDISNASTASADK